jgi:hypothetical protein
MPTNDVGNVVEKQPAWNAIKTNIRLGIFWSFGFGTLVYIIIDKYSSAKPDSLVILAAIAIFIFAYTQIDEIERRLAFAYPNNEERFLGAV